MKHDLAPFAGLAEAVESGLEIFEREDRVDIRLELGATGQSVTVTGEARLLENRTSEINTLIESKSIGALPQT